MASCGFGATGLKVSDLNVGSGRNRSVAWQMLENGVRIRKPNQFSGLVMSRRSERPFACCLNLASEAKSSVNSEDDAEEDVSSPKLSPLVPKPHEVEYLLTEICDTTSIAELELKLGGFRLYVARKLTDQSNTSLPLAIDTDTVASDLNGSASSQSLAVSKVSPPSSETLLDKAADEGLMILTSPRVGYFRRSRTIKGKRAPSSCKEKQIVKEGQVLCFIEQLGCEIPLEADVSGEVVRILREEGEPVGYGDALIAVLPSFPGIKNLQ